MSITDLDNGTLKRIYVVPHSHHDYAWVYERGWHIKRYNLIFNDVLDWLQDNPGTVWMIDNVIHSLLPFLKNSPERVEEFRARVDEGRIEIASGGYSLARPSYVGEETFVRNMTEGIRYFRKSLGIQHIDFFNNVDTASGQSNLPQILLLGGYRYYRFQRPESTLDRRGVPRAFYWKGIDGSKILVARGFGCGFLSLTYTNMDFETQWPEIRKDFYEQELATRRIDGLCPADIEMVTYGCDDTRPPLDMRDRPGRLLDFIREWNRREKTEIRISTAGEYFRELEGLKLPEYDGRLDDCELTFNLPIKGEYSFWRKRGELDKALLCLESVASISTLTGSLYPADEINRLWHRLFDITGHAMEWIHVQDEKKMMGNAVIALETARELTDDCMDFLARSVAYEEGLSHIVVNTQTFERSEVIQLYITSPTGIQGFKLLDANEQEIPYQVIKKNSHLQIPTEYRRYDYTALDVMAKITAPAFGFTSIKIVPNGERSPERAINETFVTNKVQDIPPCKSDYVVDNGPLCVTFRRGEILEIRDNKNSRTMRTMLDHPLCTLHFVKTAQNISWMQPLEIVAEYDFEPREGKILANGPLYWKYRISGRIFSAEATLDIIIKKDTPALEFELSLDNKPEADGFFTVDFACDTDAQVFSDVYFGVEPRDARSNLLEYVENYLKGQIYGRNFTAFNAGELPVALVSGNCSVYYIHDYERNNLRLILNRVMLNEYSNEDWFMDVPHVRMEGRHTFQFALFAAQKAGRFDDIQRFTKTYHYPLLTAAKDDHSQEGMLCPVSFAQADCPHVIQSAFYMEDGWYCARFFETCGEDAVFSLSLSRRIKEAYLSDFNGEPTGQQCEVSPDKLSIRIKMSPWQIITLRFHIDEAEMTDR